ncbi:hypothetical protein NP493_403g07048 [Ridgeia piscesae]|uniref:Sodium/hydrogen exchanger n=1 Tax=Ridgeia piscesae TaxID=27915 RepID=A0AAD9L2S7_RIDPI|nr:hypothetical protein NP493_403g07048 [Ridgeia piscesae]
MAGVRWLIVCLVVLALRVCVAPAGAGAIPVRARRAVNETSDAFTESVPREAPGNETGAGEGGEEGEMRYSVAKFDFAHVAGPMIVTGWILLASIAKIGFHLNHKLSSIFPESCLLIILGVLLGLILYFADIDGYALQSDTFFLYLLPPIILDSGYFMPYRTFFDNLGSILLFAIVGTIYNTITIGLSIWGCSAVGIALFPIHLKVLHCLVFASLLSAVDPVAVLAVFEEIHVNEVLHIVLFGESLLNDGVSVVLYHMFETYSEIELENIIALDIVAGITSFFVVAIGATLIGVLYGLLAGFISKFTEEVRVIEPLLVFVMGYLSYLTSESLHLSGILACTFCGMVMRQFVEANVSPKSRTTIKYFMKMLASICETIIFVLLGISTVINTHHWDTAFVLLVVVFCLVYRAIGVIVLSFMANRVRVDPLSNVDQFIMAYGGLRGAIAFSLVSLLDEETFPNKRLFLTTTIVVVYFTVFLLGSTIKPLVDVLRVKKGDSHKQSMNERIHHRAIDHLMAGIEDITGHVGPNELREKFHYLSNKFVKPLLLKKGHSGRGESLMKVYQRLTEMEMRQMVKTSSYTVLSQMHVTPSASQSLAKYFTSHYPSTGNLAESQNGMVDLRSVGVQDSRRMRDEGLVHHMIEDVMFKPRKRFCQQSHHMLPDMEGRLMFPHMARHNLRHAAARERNRVQQHHPHNGRKKKKNVGFTAADSDDEDAHKKHDSSDKDGITFTVGTDSMDGTENIGYEPTEAESALPWKREEVEGEPELSRFSRASGAEETLATPMSGYRFFDDTASAESDAASTGSDPFIVGNEPFAAGNDPIAAGSDMADSSHGATAAIDDEAVGIVSDEFKTTVL